MEIQFPLYVVRTIADGEHYYPPRDFTSDVLAEAFYGSTVDRLNREDPKSVEITVQFIDVNDDNHVVYERTFPRV